MAVPRRRAFLLTLIDICKHITASAAAAPIGNSDRIWAVGLCPARSCDDGDDMLAVNGALLVSLGLASHGSNVRSVIEGRSYHGAR